MKRPVFRRTVLFTVLILATAGVAFFTSTGSEAAGCSPCLGPVNISGGYGSGETCEEADQAARADAIASAPLGSDCIPCESSLTSSCYRILDCGPNCWGATATYYYKCKTCMQF